MEEWLSIIEKWSSTFYAPISRMPEGMREATGSVYLCLRAIDEVEDHQKLSQDEKCRILRDVSFAIQMDDYAAPYSRCSDICNVSSWSAEEDELPSVTLRLSDWFNICPKSLRTGLRNCVSAMADRMATWAENGWDIESRKDLDRYSYSVSGTVALFLTDIFEHYEIDKRLSRLYAIGFGNYLQAVNIFRGSIMDSRRGVDFFPNGWDKEDMIFYAYNNRKRAENYIKSMGNSKSGKLCKIIVSKSDRAIEIIESGGRPSFDGVGKP